MIKKIKPCDEWFKQANYTVFICHLSIEKALKGLYTKKFKIVQPKIHNLIYLIKKVRFISS